jgi:PKD repeat protein
MRINHLLLYLIGMLFSTLTLAHNQSLTCSKNGTLILYTNGINVQEIDAKRSALRLQKLVAENKIDKKSDVEIDLNYNYSFGATLDILELITQKLPNAFLQSNSFIDKYDAFYKFKNGLSKVALEYIDIRAMEAIINDVNQLILNQTLNYRDLNTSAIAKKYREYLNEGKKIIAIGHSQGGLFINNAYNSVNYPDKDKFFQTVHIATPADTIANNGSYVTFINDEVINNLRNAFGCLPGNEDATNLPWPLSLFDRVEQDFKTEEDKIDYYLNHGIETTYLADSELRAAIGQKIEDVALNLESNCGEPPVAAFNYTIDSTNPLKVNFNGSSSYDPEMKPLIYRWNFGDGTTGTGASPTHVYSSSGTYRVTLKVIDEDENESENIAQIDITVTSDSCGQVILGCSEYGAQLGKLHKNSDGSCGGFVSFQASVSEFITISENSNICGNTIIYASSATSIENSTINNSNLMTYGIPGIWMINSKIENSTISEEMEGILIHDSKIKNATVTASFYYLQIRQSEINANLSAQAIGVTNSIINAPVDALNGITIINSTINEPLSGFNIYVDSNRVRY